MADPYPENERCDDCCSVPARYQVLDHQGIEVAVCCKECASLHVPVFRNSAGQAFRLTSDGLFTLDTHA